MNQSQLKYARERVDAAFAAKKRSIKEACTTKAVTLTRDEKLAALEEGRFTIDRTQTGGYANAINFGETFSTVDTEKETALLIPVQAAYRKLMDELVLGDATEALALIAAFEGE